MRCIPGHYKRGKIPWWLSFRNMSKFMPKVMFNALIQQQFSPIASEIGIALPYYMV